MNDEMIDDENQGVEPEWCEPCTQAIEEEGYEYTFDYTVIDGIAYCDHCGRIL